MERFKKQKELRRLSKEIKPDTTQGMLVLWGAPNWKIVNFKVNKVADIATGRIKVFNKDSVSLYPTFKNPAIDFEIGKSLCKLGFPLYTIKPQGNISEKRFDIPPDMFPMPLFAIEGIYARDHVYQDEKTRSILAKFIATSSPGLHGQSGGSTFDTEGRIWGMQSHTNYQAIVIKDDKDPSGKKKIRSTFDYGLGTHAETIINFLQENQISIDISKD